MNSLKIPIKRDLLENQGLGFQQDAVAQFVKTDMSMLILHGDSDVRLAYQESVNFKNYADSVGTDVELITFNNADHTEGMLTETERYRDELVGFFEGALD
jgi:dipeptidyl aminopeptidase/acylaminoacyl peptidase